jgi:hypothetical protein
MFSLGRDPYRDIDLTPEMTVREETILTALRGAKKTISDVGGTTARALPADKEACLAYQETDDLIRRTSESVNQRKIDLGPARYVRWGNFCLSWLAVRNSLPLESPAVIMTRVATARQFTVLCADEISRLPTTATAVDVKKVAQAAPTKKKLRTEFDWKQTVLAVGVVGGVVLLVKRVFGKRETV